MASRPGPVGTELHTSLLIVHDWCMHATRRIYGKLGLKHQTAHALLACCARGFSQEQCRRVGREVTLHPQDMKQPPRTKRKGAKAKAGRLKHNLRVPSRAELQRRMSSG